MTIDQYISKQTGSQKEICMKLRDIILKSIQSAQEAMKWGVPTYLNGEIYFVGLKDSVNLGFGKNYLSEKTLQTIPGEAKSVKHFKYFKVEEIDEQQIKQIIKELILNMKP